MAKGVKATELRAMSAEELDRRAAELRENLFTQRLGLRTGELHQTSQIKVTRRELARVLTVRREIAQKGGAAAAPAPAPKAE